MKNKNNNVIISVHLSIGIKYNFFDDWIPLYTGWDSLYLPMLHQKQRPRVDHENESALLITEY